MENSKIETPVQEEPVKIKRDLNWVKILYFLHLYFGSVYGLYLVFFQAKVVTTLFGLSLALLSVWGVTIGAHRLWAHQCFKASRSVRIILMILQTIVGQGSIYNWVLDHRVHHKYFNTVKDPYNHKRGFLYSFIMCHFFLEGPSEKDNCKNIDMSDLEQDDVVMFQKRTYWVLMPILSLLLPINAPFEYFGDSLVCSVYVAGILRYTIAIHAAWLINSSALLWGLKPNEKVSESNMVFFVKKSVWPQYHYLLPWDYKTGEYGNYDNDSSTAMIRVFAALRLITHLRTISTEQVRSCLAQSVEHGKPVLDLLHAEGKLSHSPESILEEN